MGLFDRFRRGRGQPAGGGPSARTVAELKEFLRTREGVEGYVEPPTTVYAMTLCLVAGDGEYIRRPVRDERHSRGLCSEFGVPLYDARIVGYPRRMRDYERGVPGERVELADLPPLEVTEERERDD